MEINSVILAGGTGTRLWPMSRELMPKQFLKIIGDHTLFQETMLRATTVCEGVSPLIICQDNHYFYCQDQMTQIGLHRAHYLLEPVARNTAGAVALAALYYQTRGEGDIPMLIMPSDHLLQDINEFKQCIQDAWPVALDKRLVTFGIRPTKPETGYGYIEMGNEINVHVNHVARFVEKPNRDTAEEYMRSGKFLWNSGIFMMTPNAFLSELQLYQPDVLQCADESFKQSHLGTDFHRILEEWYESCQNISIDYAVMEKSERVAVVPLNTLWSDLGCWASVSENHVHDHQHNVLIGDVIAEKSHDCYFNAQDNRLIAAIGLENKIVISTADAILIADKQYAQEVKNLVNTLKSANHATATSHQRVYRPWGYYESLASGPKYQVKHIMVKPHSRLSLQTHQHRAEHWVVVRGIADVVNNDQMLRLYANQSTYIPQGSAHRLCNNSDEPLHVIEVQSGDYLGEDDIVRLQDDYERMPL